MAQIKRKGPSIRAIKQRLDDTRIEVATEVARQSVGAVNAIARSDFASGRNCYGEARALGRNGNVVSLHDTGRLGREFGFEQIGTSLRMEIAIPYAKYMVGRFEILPIGDRSAIPIRWKRVIDGIFEVVAANTSTKKQLQRVS